MIGGRRGKMFRPPDIPLLTLPRMNILADSNLNESAAGSTAPPIFLIWAPMTRRAERGTSQSCSPCSSYRTDFLADSLLALGKVAQVQ